jgi:hypothetical protein
VVSKNQISEDCLCMFIFSSIWYSNNISEFKIAR